MLLSISHRTKLNYSVAISESVMEMRAMPRTDEHQVLRWFDIQALPSAKACQHTDWLGNTVIQFSLHTAHRQLIIASRCLVEIRRTSTVLRELTAPVKGLIDDHRSWHFLQHQGPVNRDPALPVLAEQIGLCAAHNVGHAIEIVTTRTRDLMAYRPGVTHSSSSVSEALQLGAGVCQDFTHLSLALLRYVGLPCRYVSGYLYKPGAAELQTHAWTEAFVPEVGWLAFDPTHRQLVNEQYVTVAVGRSYADVPPNRGVFHGEAVEQIEVGVSIKPVDTRARLTPYSTGLERLPQTPTSPLTTLRSRHAPSQESPLVNSNATLQIA